MKSEKNKKDPFIKSIFDEGGTEQPSNKFTSKIIETIKAQAPASAFEYEPVISKKAWLIILLFGVALFLYLLLGYTPEGQSLNIEGFSLKFNTTPIKEILSKIAVSFTLTPILKTSLIALTFFTFSNLIIFELKNRSFIK